jgi:hypothetical protein
MNNQVLQRNLQGFFVAFGIMRNSLNIVDILVVFC